ncbi:MAG: Uma2 family endonuclease [Stigonema ocellatum SAG 48.90 = DSM 106950]|nr:Uma2 family endonuclease [Stigonema ocellatum SAG 48.90 = DSM 106950]
MVLAQVPSGVPHIRYQVSWEKLSDDYVLPDEPVENTSQPLLAAALRESLELIGFLTPERLVASNLGICATVNGKTIVKAPDWLYVPKVLPLDTHWTRRSYTPRVEGDVLAVVMEFLSETDGGEYSSRPFYPYGKLWFYERILQVPLYIIFEPESGTLEMRQLVEGLYQVQQPDENGRYWIASMNLYLGIWHGTKAERTGYWLRWWDAQGKLLLWGTERLDQERQRVERLESYLREQGIDPDMIP